MPDARRAVNRNGIAVGLVVAAVSLAAIAVDSDAVLTRLAWLAADPVRYAAACVLLALLRPLVAWPPTLLGVAVGFGLGVWPVGLPVALVLVLLTSLPPYLLARRLGGDGRLAAAGRRFVDATGDVRSVAATRLLPTPADAVSAGAGAAGVPMRAFLVGTAVGAAPWAAAGVLAGASLDALATGTASVDLRLVAAAALVSGLLFARPAYRAYRERAV